MENGPSSQCAETGLPGHTLGSFVAQSLLSTEHSSLSECPLSLGISRPLTYEKTQSYRRRLEEEEEGGERYNNQKETRGIIHRTFGHIYVSRDKGLFLLFLLVHGDKRLVGTADDCQLRFEDKRKSVPRSILLNLLRENFQPNLTVLGRLNVDKLCPPTTF